MIRDSTERITVLAAWLEDALIRLIDTRFLEHFVFPDRSTGMQILNDNLEHVKGHP